MPITRTQYFVDRSHIEHCSLRSVLTPSQHHTTMPMIGVPSSKGLSETVGVFLRNLNDFLEYLQLPSRSEYWQALQHAGKDAWIAAQSLNQLSLLTFRPFLLLLWLLSQKLYLVAKFLFRHLFQGLYISFLKGIEQSKWLSKRLVAWQYSLTPNQLKIEVGIVVLGIVLVLLRRHIQQQGYVQRVTRWYRVKQRRVVKVSTRARTVSIRVYCLYA